MAARVGVLVVGGGVSGLWTLWSLLERGHDAWLAEATGLGAGQTLASQGILHAGVKYRLPGNTADSSRSVADVQPVWEAALAGKAGPDLSSVRTISAVTHLWSLPSLGARMAAEVAARVMRSGTRRVERGVVGGAPLGGAPHPGPLPPGERERRGDAGGVFDGAPKGVSVFEAPERVVEPAGLVRALREACGGRARVGRVTGVRLDGWEFAAVVNETDEVYADSVVMAAGGGNAALLEAWGLDVEGVCQRRPLHQVVGRGAPFELNGHCLQASDKPALTVTTGELGGERTWYLGGDLAETGVGLSEAEQCERAWAAIARCLGWVDVSEMRWSSFEIDRAEGKTADGKRPDGPVVREIASGDPGRLLAVWPTKLVLAPVAAERVVEALGEPAARSPDEAKRTGLSGLPEADVAEVVW